MTLAQQSDGATLVSGYNTSIMLLAQLYENDKEMIEEVCSLLK